MTIQISPRPHRASLVTFSVMFVGGSYPFRQRHGAAAPVILCRIGVKDAFRQVPVDPVHAATFGYVFGEYAVVGLFLQFGWRSSHGYWDLVASPLEHAHNQTRFQDAVVSEHGRKAVAHVSVDADSSRETMLIPPDCERLPCTGVSAGASDVGRETMPIRLGCERAPGAGGASGAFDAGRETMPIPPDCEHVPGTGGNAGDPFFVRFYVDDGILVEVRFFRDGRRLRRAIESLASDHFRLIGPRGSQEPPLLEAHKILGWSTRLEVLGWVLDTDKLTISKLRQLLADWPQSRRSATCSKQISELTGVLLHVSVVVRPGKFFVQRLLAHANVPLSSPTSVFVVEQAVEAACTSWP